MGENEQLTVQRNEDVQALEVTQQGLWCRQHVTQGQQVISGVDQPDTHQ